MNFGLMNEKNTVSPAERWRDFRKNLKLKVYKRPRQDSNL